MAALLTLVCHASTPGMRTAAFPDDEPLEERVPGKPAPRVAGLRRIDRSWVAPELRTRQTADLLGLAATVDPALRECDYGRWRGRSFTDIQQVEGERALLQWTRDPAASPHGGETMLELMTRAGDRLVSTAGSGGHAVVVTHASVIRAMIIHAIEAPAASFWRIDIAPLSRATLSFNGQWRLRSTGCAASEG